MSDTRDHPGGDRADLCEDLSWYAIGSDCSEAEFLAVSKVYAREVVDAFDLVVTPSALDWELSKRAKRRAGLPKYEDTTPTTIVLSWKLFANEGWDAMAATIRHELIHAHLLNTKDDPSHGEEFEALAEELKTHVHCDQFVEPEWIVRFTECGHEFPRYRASKVVRHPDQYSCGECGGPLISEARA
jgi:predicted SprT family Zn-dependent metalloprotease